MPLGAQHFWIQRLTSDAPNISNKVTVTVQDVVSRDKLRINSIDFTAHVDTTIIGSRQFSIGADDNEAAIELAECIQAAFPTYTISVKNNKITIVWVVVAPTITLPSGPLRLTLENVQAGDQIGLDIDTFTAHATDTDTGIKRFGINGTDIEDTERLYECIIANLDPTITVTKRNNRLIFLTGGLGAPGYIFTGVGFSTSLAKSFLVEVPVIPTYFLPTDTIYKLTFANVLVDQYVTVIDKTYRAIVGDTIINERKFNMSGDDIDDTTEVRLCFSSPTYGIRDDITIEQAGNTLILSSNLSFTVEASDSITVERLNVNCYELNINTSTVLKHNGFLLTNTGGYTWETELDGITITMTLESEATPLQTQYHIGQKLKFHNIQSAMFSTGADIVTLAYDSGIDRLVIDKENTTLDCCVGFEPATVVAPFILKQVTPFSGGRASDPNNYNLTVIGHGSTDGNDGTTNTQRFMPDHLAGLRRLDQFIGGYDLGYRTLEGSGWAVLQNDIQDTRLVATAVQSILKCNAIMYSYPEGGYLAYPELFPDPLFTIRETLIKSYPEFPFGLSAASDLSLQNRFVLGKAFKLWHYNPTDEGSWDYVDSPQMTSKYVPLIASPAVLDSIVITIT